MLWSTTLEKGWGEGWGWGQLTPGHILRDWPDFIKKATGSASMHERVDEAARNTTGSKQSLLFVSAPPTGFLSVPLLPHRCNLYRFCHKPGSMLSCKICVLGQSQAVDQGPVKEYSLQDQRQRLNKQRLLESRRRLLKRLHSPNI